MRNTGTTPTLMAAAIFCFLWALFALTLIGLQFEIGLGAAIFGGKLKSKLFAHLLMAGWNLVVTGLYIWIGVGLIKRDAVVGSWAIWTNVLNSILIIIQGGAWLVLLPLQIGILMLVLIDRRKLTTGDSLPANGHPGARHPRPGGPPPSPSPLATFVKSNALPLKVAALATLGFVLALAIIAAMKSL